MVPGRYRTIAPNKMARIVMNDSSRISTQSLNLCLPGRTELRTTIATAEIASMIKVDFNITGYDVLCSGTIFNYVKCISSPGFTRAIMSIAQFTVFFNIPTITTLSRLFAVKHHNSLLLLVRCVV